MNKYILAILLLAVPCFAGINTGPTSGGSGSIPTNISNGNFMLKTNGFGYGTTTLRSLTIVSNNVNDRVDITSLTNAAFLTMQSSDSNPSSFIQIYTQNGGTAVGLFYGDLINTYGLELNYSAPGVFTARNPNGTTTVDGGNVTASGTVQSEFGVFTNNDIPSVTYSDSRVVTVLGNLAGNYLTLADGAYGYVDFRNSVSNHVTLGAGARVQIIMEDDASNVVVNLNDSINNSSKISVGGSTNLTIQDDGIGNSLEVYCENVLGRFQTDGEGNFVKYYNNNNFSRANVSMGGNMSVVDVWQSGGIFDAQMSGTFNHLYSAYLQNSTNYFVMDNANNNINFYTQSSGSNHIEISAPVNASIEGYKQANGNSEIYVSGHTHLYGLIPTSVTNDYSSDGLINFATYYGNGNGLTNLVIASSSSTSTNHIQATGITNNVGKDAYARVSGNTIAITIKASDGSIQDSYTLTNTVEIHLAPGEGISAASGLTGTMRH